MGEFGPDRQGEPPGVEGRQTRPGREYLGDRRKHELYGHPGDEHHHGALVHRLPRQRMRLLSLDPDGKGRLARGHGRIAHSLGPAPRSAGAVRAAMATPSDVRRQRLSSQEDSTWHLPGIMVIFPQPHRATPHGWYRHGAG